MNKIVFWFILSCILPLFLSAQEIIIEGKIVNAEDSLPIPFATIGVEKKNFGTVANEDGFYKYKFCPSHELGAADSFVVSCVGFYPKKFGINNLKRDSVIYLKPNITSMNEVLVRPVTSYKDVVLGKANHVGLGGLSFYTIHDKHFDDKLGREGGAIIKLNAHRIYSINNLNVYIGGTQFKKVLFRICMYKVSNGQIVSENILNHDVRWEIAKIGWNKLDLDDYKIVLHDMEEIAVTLQWIKSEPIDERSKFFDIKSSFPSADKSTIFRDKSRSEWSLISANLCLFLTDKSCLKYN